MERGQLDIVWRTVFFGGKADVRVTIRKKNWNCSGDMLRDDDRPICNEVASMVNASSAHCATRKRQIALETLSWGRAKEHLAGPPEAMIPHGVLIDREHRNLPQVRRQAKKSAGPPGRHAIAYGCDDEEPREFAQGRETDKRTSSWPLE
ncbi:hypothetical protein AVEN_227298-1 [Araneus ventricosus]|uniref:Uncharacterized protein n=1 Tax=Araneus ventricosus TaxID=182803 RepID=A0A4Y2X832_ARAVE|nr:hypothetical protein AVEN_227298-1 [Araneus ventricosus]